jgi:competence protein ComEC
MPTETATYHFYRQPFVLIFTCFAIGILLGQFIRDYNTSIFLFCCFSIVSITAFYRDRLNGKLFFLFAGLAFMFLGILVYVQKTNRSEVNRFEKIYAGNNPYLFRITEISKTGGAWRKCVAEMVGVYNGDKLTELNQPFLVFLEQEGLHAEKGDLLISAAEISPIENRNNPGEFDAVKYWEGKGIYHLTFIGSTAYRLIDRTEQGWFETKITALNDYLGQVFEKHFEGQQLGVMKALVLGDKSLLDTETKTSFSNSGAMHVLAVSGLHIGLILYLFLFVLERMSRFLSKRNALLIVIALLWIYAVITGLSPSVLRAVFMFTVLAGTQLFAKKYDSMNVLFFSAFVLLIFNPLYLFDIGFQLSYLAMVGIFVFYRPIEKTIVIHNWLLNKVWQGTAIGFAAQLMTAPLSLYYFHQFPNYFVLTNIGMMAFSGLILGFGLGLFAAAEVGFLAKIVGFFLWFILLLTIEFIEWVEQLPGAVANGYTFSLLFVALLTLAFFYLRYGQRKWTLVGASISILVIFVFITIERNQNMQQEEVCVFNANQLIVSVKKGDEIYCFYKGQEKELNKAKFALESYSKIYPGKIHYQSLADSSYSLKLSDEHIEIKHQKGFYQLEVNKEKYAILYKNNDLLNVYDDATVIGLPYISSPVDVSLKTGSYRIPLNQAL